MNIVSIGGNNRILSSMVCVKRLKTLAVIYNKIYLILRLNGEFNHHRKNYHQRNSKSSLSNYHMGNENKSFVARVKHSTIPTRERIVV